MSGWQFKFSRGWRDETIPPAIKESVLADVPEKTTATICIASSFAVDDERSIRPCYHFADQERADGSATAQMVFMALASFFKSLENSEYDFVSLIWSNRRAHSSLVIERPAASEPAELELADAIREFSNAIAGSDETGSWSLCEWAAISCSRATD